MNKKGPGSRHRSALKKMRALPERIARRIGGTIDVVEALDRSREGRSRELTSALSDGVDRSKEPKPSRPRIGITGAQRTDAERAAFRQYIEAVEAAGGEAVPISPIPSRTPCSRAWTGWC